MTNRRTNDLNGPVTRLPDALRGHDRSADRDSVSPAVAERGSAGGDAHGRNADNPAQIPAQGWKDVAVRVKRQVKEDNVGLIGAGVAFYSFLALFPAMIALISLYGLVVQPSEVAKQINSLLESVPQEQKKIITDQLTELTKGDRAGLGISLVLAILLALWSASGGMRALMTGLNIAYDEVESRKFVKLRVISLGLTLAVIVFTVVTLTAVIGVPAAFDPDQPIGLALAWLRWPVLAALMVAGLAFLYRYGPDRDKPKWGWASWGAGIATALWLLMTVVFSFYVSSFANFQKTYGGFASVIVLLTWMSLTAFIVLLGAEINAELERQTTEDTTEGADRPMGQRDAYSADTVGATADELKNQEVTSQ
ncbi:MAG: YihY/virulence factor BrkB family protein [Mycobacteriales bacterium]